MSSSSSSSLEIVKYYKRKNSRKFNNRKKLKKENQLRQENIQAENERSEKARIEEEENKLINNNPKACTTEYAKTMLNRAFNHESIKTYWKDQWYSTENKEEKCCPDHLFEEAEKKFDEITRHAKFWQGQREIMHCSYCDQDKPHTEMYSQALLYVHCGGKKITWARNSFECNRFCFTGTLFPLNAINLIVSKEKYSGNIEFGCQTCIDIFIIKVCRHFQQ